MKILLLVISLIISCSALAEPATLSFSPSVTPDVTYNVYKNDVRIFENGTSLSYDVETDDGDFFYVRSAFD